MSPCTVLSVLCVAGAGVVWGGGSTAGAGGCLRRAQAHTPVIGRVNAPMLASHPVRSTACQSHPPLAQRPVAIRVPSTSVAEAAVAVFCARLIGGCLCGGEIQRGRCRFSGWLVGVAGFVPMRCGLFMASDYGPSDPMG
ncbi:hypothetical protein BJF83_23535 [Nocardiopsis sp. CNR-923]|nr:hypothetical protein BJF83_23535 [Nocardiopsis sp. CNR-923]